MSSELETCLTKAISEFKVRDMLTKFGLPEDAEVTLEMQLDENSKPIASCAVPTTVKKDNISSDSMSLINLHDLHNLLADDFINPAIKTFNLMEFIASVDGSIENNENKLIISLNSNNSNCKMDLFLTMCCCCQRSNGRCCKFGTDCSRSCCPC